LFQTIVNYCFMSGVMDTTTNYMQARQVVKSSKHINTKRCLSCGTDKIKPGRRRYCTKQCRHKINWVLSLSKGLLRALNAKQAAFFFTSDFVALDVLPAWSKGISRFVLKRSAGNTPADDLKKLVLECGSKWHSMVKNNNSKSYASFCLAGETYKKDLHPDKIRPDIKSRPRLSEQERAYIRILRLEKSELAFEDNTERIKSAYKKMAKVYHPDIGGDENKFKQLNEAHSQMLQWVENPQFTCRKALRGCWAYDGFTSRWSPPL